MTSLPNPLRAKTNIYNFCRSCLHPHPGLQDLHLHSCHFVPCPPPGPCSYIHPPTAFHATLIEYTHIKGPTRHGILCLSPAGAFAPHLLDTADPAPLLLSDRSPSPQDLGVSAGYPPSPAAPRSRRAGWLTRAVRRDSWRPWAASKRHAAALADPGSARGAAPPTRKNSPNPEACSDDHVTWHCPHPDPCPSRHPLSTSHCLLPSPLRPIALPLRKGDRDSTKCTLRAQQPVRVLPLRVTADAPLSQPGPPARSSASSLLLSPSLSIKPGAKQCNSSF